jgi:hypothetical protein
MRTIPITSLLLAPGPSLIRAQDAANAGSRSDGPDGGPPGQSVKPPEYLRTFSLGPSLAPYLFPKEFP